MRHNSGQGTKNITSELILSLRTLRIKMKSGINLVDVRNREAYNKLRIPGSINVPFYAVKTKSFLKAGESVLINEGYAYSDLESTCLSLRKSGFKVWILAGGLNAWVKSGLPLEGGGLYKRELNKVSAREFFVEKNYRHWTLINISSPKKKTSETLPGSVYLNKGNGGAFLKGFSKIMSQNQKDPLALAMIYSDDGKDYEKVALILKKSRFKNIFFLQGGLEGYNNYLKQKVSLHKGKKIITREKKCPDCPH
jgi:rhodanese-related sulfurtransferase